MKVLLLDADSILYIIGWAHKDHDDEELVMQDVNQFMVDIVAATNAEAYLGVFSPKHTFRHDISPVYKANRPPIHPGIAKWKQKIIDYCIKEYGFFTADYREADDVLSILGNSKQEGTEWILCHIDKDLRQISGSHYNYSKKKWEVISEVNALVIFWTQVLVGDTGDNVKGARLIGPVKAEKILTRTMQDYNGDLEDARLHLSYAVESTFKEQNGEDWKRDYQDAVALIKLLDPTPELVELYKSKIQMVKFEDQDSGLIESLLNHDNGDTGVLQSSERSHSDDLLHSSDDFSKQV